MRSNKISVLGISIIIFFSLSNSGLSYSGLSYKVKTGDSQTYKINKDYTHGQPNPVTFQQTFQDGTVANVSYQEGLIFTIEICYLTGTGVNATVYTKATINGKTSSCSSSYIENLDQLVLKYQFYKLHNIPLYGLLNPFMLPVIPITDNLTYFKSIPPQIITTSGIYYPEMYNITYTLLGNNLLVKIIGILNICSINFCPQVSSSAKIQYEKEINADVQTGWYRNVSVTETFENGTIYTQYEASQYSITSSGGLPGFEISSALLVVSIAVPIVLIKRKRK